MALPWSPVRPAGTPISGLPFFWPMAAREHWSSGKLPLVSRCRASRLKSRLTHGSLACSPRMRESIATSASSRKCSGRLRGEGCSPANGKFSPLPYLRVIPFSVTCMKVGGCGGRRAGAKQLCSKCLCTPRMALLSPCVSASSSAGNDSAHTAGPRGPLPTRAAAGQETVRLEAGEVCIQQD